MRILILFIPLIAFGCKDSKKEEYNAYKEKVQTEVQTEAKREASEAEIAELEWKKTKKMLTGDFSASLSVDYSDFRGIKVGQIYEEEWSLAISPSGVLKVNVKGGSSFGLKENPEHEFIGTYREQTLLGWRDFNVTISEIKRDKTGGLSFEGLKTRKDNDGQEASFVISAYKVLDGEGE